MNKTLLMAGGLTPLLLTSVSGAALAQATTTPEASSGVDRIVVTAEKRETFLEDVPASVLAFTADEIDKQQIDTLTDIALLSPSVAIDEGLNPIFTDISIRGIAGLGGEQETFGIYIDGYEVSANSTAGAAIRYDDLERIEVLRGPRGTTFGRNVIAGAFNITSKSVGDEIGGYVEARAENFGGLGVKGAVDIPLTDKVGIRASGFFDHSNGNIKNIGAAGGRNDFETVGGRIKLDAELTERLSMLASLTYDRHDQGLENFVADGVVPSDLDFAISVIEGGDNPFFGPGSFPFGPDLLFPDQNDTVELNTPTSYDTENTITTLRFDYSFDDMDLIWVSGFVDSKITRFEDTDLSNVDSIFLDQRNEAQFASTEIRLQSSGDKTVDWTVGAYASRASNRNRSSIFSGSETSQINFIPAILFEVGSGFTVDVEGPGLPSIPDNAELFRTDIEAVDTALALFAEADVEVAENVSLFAGVRFNYDKIEEESFGDVELVILNTLLEDGVTPTIPLIPEYAAVLGDPLGEQLVWPARLIPEQGEADFDKVTWRVGAKWEPAQNINLYGTISTGYRAGGLQLVAGLDVTDFGPEELINYEVGVKSFLFDQRASVNLALFYMDWKDVQILTRTEGTFFSATRNAGQAEVLGLELDWIAEVTDHLVFGGGFAYLDTEILEFDDFVGPDPVGLPLPNTSEFSGNGYLEYNRPITSKLSGFGRITYIYTGEQLQGFVEGSEQQRDLDKWERVDLRFGVEVPDDWRIEAFGTNIFDDIYATGKASVGFGLSGQYTVSPPRRYGVRFTKQF